MKKTLVLVIMFISFLDAHSATIYVYVHNVNGNTTKIRMNKITNLTVKGFPINDPFTIDLQTRCNIMGYPSSSSQDEKELFCICYRNLRIFCRINNTISVITYFSLVFYDIVIFFSLTFQNHPI